MIVIDPVIFILCLSLTRLKVSLFQSNCLSALEFLLIWQRYHGDWFSCITIQYHISSYLSMKPFITIPRGRGESKNFTHGLSNNGHYEDSHSQFLEGLRLRLRLETLDVEEVRWGHFVQQTESRAGHVGTQAAALWLTLNTKVGHRGTSELMTCSSIQCSSVPPAQRSRFFILIVTNNQNISIFRNQ